jgi:hypothetical protein
MKNTSPNHTAAGSFFKMPKPTRALSAASRLRSKVDDKERGDGLRYAHELSLMLKI